MNKKGQIFDELTTLITVLVAVGVILVVGFMIFSETEDQVIEQTGVTATVTNESVTFTNNSYTALANSANAMALSCTSVCNNTACDETFVADGGLNWTCTAGRGIRFINSTGNEANATLKVTYTHQPRSTAFNGTAEATNATADIVPWLAIIVVTVLGLLILGLVALFKR